MKLKQIIPLILLPVITFAGQIKSITVDLRKENKPFALETTAQTTPQFRVYVRDNGSIYHNTTNLTGVMYYASNDTTNVGMIITNTTAGIDYLDWWLTPGETAQPGKYFAQFIFYEGTNVVQEWVRGTLTILPGGGVTASESVKWNTTNMWAEIDRIDAVNAAQDAAISNINVLLPSYATTGTVAAIDDRVTVLENASTNIGDITSVDVNGGILTGGTNAGDVIITLTTNALTNALNDIYLNSYTEADPIWGVISNTVIVDASQGATAYGWGNHATNGYLTSYTETDPKSLHLSGVYSAYTSTGGTFTATNVVIASTPLLTNGLATITYDYTANGLLLQKQYSTDGTNWNNYIYTYNKTGSNVYGRIITVNGLPVPGSSVSIDVSNIVFYSWTNPLLCNKTNDFIGEILLVDDPATAKAAVNYQTLTNRIALNTPANWSSYPAQSDVYVGTNSVIMGTGWTVTTSNGVGVLSYATITGDTNSLQISQNGTAMITAESGLVGCSISNFVITSGTNFQFYIYTNGVTSAPVIQYNSDLINPNWQNVAAYTNTYPATSNGCYYVGVYSTADSGFFRAVYQGGMATITLNGDVTATSFTGNGYSITNINGANIKTGTITSNQIDAATDAAYRSGGGVSDLIATNTPTAGQILYASDTSKTNLYFANTPSETDPIFTNSVAYNITASDTNTWSSGGSSAPTWMTLGLQGWFPNVGEYTPTGVATGGAYSTYFYNGASDSGTYIIHAYDGTDGRHGQDYWYDVYAPTSNVKCTMTLKAGIFNTDSHWNNSTYVASAIYVYENDGSWIGTLNLTPSSADTPQTFTTVFTNTTRHIRMLWWPATCYSNYPGVGVGELRWSNE